MSIEAEFDRESNGQGAQTFDGLPEEDRRPVLEAFAALMDLGGSPHAKAVKVVLGFLHRHYEAQALESRLGMDPGVAHALSEAFLARCGAAKEALEMTTDHTVILAVLENLTTQE